MSTLDFDEVRDTTSTSTNTNTDMNAKISTNTDTNRNSNSNTRDFDKITKIYPNMSISKKIKQVPINAIPRGARYAACVGGGGGRGENPC